MDRKEDKLGLPANLGQKQFPPDHVFGVRVTSNQWNAGKCITGEANEHEVRPDDDLGRTNKYGFRNITKEGDENRLFGVPTIRYDIPKPKMQSVADPNVLLSLCRTTQTKQRLLNCSSPSNLLVSEWDNRTSTCLVLRPRSRLSSKTSAFRSRAISSMRSSSDPRSSRGLFWIRSAAVPSRRVCWNYRENDHHHFIIIKNTGVFLNEGLSDGGKGD